MEDQIINDAMRVAFELDSAFLILAVRLTHIAGLSEAQTNEIYSILHDVKQEKNQTVKEIICKM